MRDEIIIRKLGSRDVDEFVRIRLQGLLTDPASFGRSHAEQAARPRSDFVAYLAPSRKRIQWGAFRDERLVGLIRLEQDGRAVRRTIYSMYVSPDERRRGLARRLMTIATLRAKRQPVVRQIHLYVAATNERALALYHSLGFLTCGLEENVYCVDGQWHSEFTMRKFARRSRPLLKARRAKVRSGRFWHEVNER